MERRSVRTWLFVGIGFLVCAAGAAFAHDLIFENGFGPGVKILTPQDGEIRAAGVPIPFNGSVTESAPLVWTSSIDGQIGTGTSFSAALTAGEHVITLTATGPDASRAQIHISVEP